MEREITAEEVDRLYEKLAAEAAASGYFLNPDKEFALDLARSLIVNTERYGYASCPCRLASGDRGDDRDIVCPCDYRDPDLGEHGACFCALYVSEALAKGDGRVKCVPERRPSASEKKEKAVPDGRTGASLPYPVWRCRVCGYLCAREEPPDTCPICKVKKDRFERFI